MRHINSHSLSSFRMAKAVILSLLCSLFLSALVSNCHAHERKLHVVYMGGQAQGDVSVATKHHSMLHKAIGSFSLAQRSLVYSYGRSFNGFAARLTPEEASRISKMEGVVSVNPSRIYQLHTVRSWDFTNLTTNRLGGPQESDVIIGLIDTGIWPEHPSFNDSGFSSPPTTWKGACTGTNFTCNNKIIGARYYNSDGEYYGDVPSPRDTEGHGTHTASTASGNEVDASYFGLAKGKARGGVPSSRIAVYKVCWSFGCSGADILKAFDDAIADGVNILSVSLGYSIPQDYFDDPIAIGSFHAMRNGILTSNSAGNSGPYPVSASNVAPWTLTVAASSIDRRFVAKMQLGNGQIFTGSMINTFDLNGTSYPLIWGGDAANYTIGSGPDYSKNCILDAMSSDAVAGKIVYCEALVDDGTAIIQSKGVGVIYSDPFYVNPDVVFSWPLPSTLISPEDGKSVLEYIRSSDNPTATIFYTEAWKDEMAPIVVSFSSRGPNAITPDILKPDITAPGVDILAAWSPMSPSSVSEDDTRSTLFNIISGTSMSCPHASGAAAYVKAAHPDWSPSAIKSALMTTAYVLDPSKHEDAEFSYGSGHINPVGAKDPGLVFNASEADYVNLLCKQGYNTSTLQLVTGDNSTCVGVTPGRAWDMNYPSFSLYVEDGEQILATFTRTVTNVGTASSTYTASIEMPFFIEVTVEPSTLTFSTVGETQTFTVNVTGLPISQQPIISGAITWTDGTHVVRTPLAVYNYIPGAPYNLFSDQSMTPGGRTFQRSSVYQKVGSIGQQKHIHS